MKANKMFQWAVRISLMIVIVGSFLAIPSHAAKAKPLSAPFTNCASQTEIPQAECDALVALYNSTNGAYWTNHTGWLQTDTPCSWYGVYCGPGYVAQLQFQSNHLSGTIPPELGNLINLSSLDLSNNLLSGNVPFEIGNLIQLQTLNLGNNQLSGSIPAELGNLAKLENFYLPGNQLSGSIPTQLGSLTNLRELLLDFNQLSGSIPSELGNLTQLDQLALNGNQLSGSIPPELGNLTKVQYLLLHLNQFSGSIPAELGSLTNLKYLYLGNNQLSGTIPTELGYLTKLQYIYLSENQLSGEFPKSITNLVNLSYFSFDTCQGLTSTDSTVIAFLKKFSPNWNVCDQNMVAQRVGSGIPISNGDTTPSYAEGTDLGGVSIGGVGLFEFNIMNTGSVTDLHLTGKPIVVISGDPSFKVKYQPSPLVSPGSLGNSFMIRFSPSSLGLHTATVSIANNDADNNPYTFTIQGVGAKKDAYEIDNDFSSAKTITPGVTQNHSIFPMGDHDYVKFTATGSSSIVLETSGPNGYDTEIALYDANHNLIGYDNDGGSFLYSRLERTCANLLPAGTYYLMTYVYEGVIPQYQLSYTTAECPPIVSSILRASPNPTNGSSVNFTVNFSEPVTGVDMMGPSFDDFKLTTSPGISGASILAVSGVSGSGSVYTVTVNTGSGSGTIRLDVPVTATVNDLAGNPLSGLPFITGETYTVNKNVDVYVGGALKGSYFLPPNGSTRQNYANVDSGPVKVVSTDGTPIISAIRDAWVVNGVTTSFSQLMGLPLEQLSDKYVFPGYNNVTLNEQLRIANVDTTATTVTVTIGGTPRGTYPLAAGAAVRINYPGLDSGPVVVQGTSGVKIIAAIREAWAVNGVTKSFVQLMGLPAGQLSNKYVYAAYNNVTLNEQLRIGNVDPSQSTVVTVTIGGNLKGTYPLGPGEAMRVNYPGLDSGPVIVEGTAGVNIISSIRDAWATNGVTTSFSQLMGMPAGQLSDKYVYPGYNNMTLNDQLRIANADTVPSTVTVTIGGNLKGTYPLAAGEAVRVNYPGLDSGPVVVQGTSGVKIISTIREAWAVNGITTSFVQLMGLPAQQLSTTYWFPAYNNVTLNEQLRIGMP